MKNKEWIDMLSQQFKISRTTARKMLHIMMSIKKFDNLKKEMLKRGK